MDVQSGTRDFPVSLFDINNESPRLWNWEAWQHSADDYPRDRILLLYCFALRLLNELFPDIAKRNLGAIWNSHYD